MQNLIHISYKFVSLSQQPWMHCKSRSFRDLPLSLLFMCSCVRAQLTTWTEAKEASSGGGHCLNYQLLLLKKFYGLSAPVINTFYSNFTLTDWSFWRLLTCYQIGRAYFIFFLFSSLFWSDKLHHMYHQWVLWWPVNKSWIEACLWSCNSLPPSGIVFSSVCWRGFLWCLINWAFGSSYPTRKEEAFEKAQFTFGSRNWWAQIATGPVMAH
jgi:hypothetical protein